MRGTTEASVCKLHEPCDSGVELALIANVLCNSVQSAVDYAAFLISGTL